MKLTSSYGSIEAVAGERFTDDDGMEWEIVRDTGAYSYSPIGIGGAPIIECRHVGGEPSPIWERYLNDGIGKWCGDSLACAIVRWRGKVREGAEP